VAEQVGIFCRLIIKGRMVDFTRGPSLMLSDARRFIAASTAALVVLALALPALAQQKAPTSGARPAGSATATSRPAATAPAKPGGATAPVGAVGKIAGRIMDGKEPVAFGNVIVLGTKQGTMSDDNGNFVIAGVPVGTYQVKMLFTGHDPVIKPVTVNAGQTTVLDFTIGQAKVVKEIEQIEVRAEKRIDTKSSTTKQSISAEKLREIPVDNLSQAIATKAGIVAQGGELHFRGGRGGEVKFQFDGVEATDPALGGSGKKNAGSAVIGCAVDEALATATRTTLALLPSPDVTMPGGNAE